MKYSLITIILLIATSCSSYQKIETLDKNAIETTLNSWHKAVAEFQFETYFDLMTDEAVFVGTDATEVWSKQQFMAFCKPYFDKKQTWDFKPISRNIYLQKSSQTAHFDEVLDTWMGLCRGSGVLIKENNSWKIQHYVLSVLVPNEVVKEVIDVKKETEKNTLKLLLDKQ